MKHINDGVAADYFAWHNEQKENTAVGMEKGSGLEVRNGECVERLEQLAVEIQGLVLEEE